MKRNKLIRHLEDCGCYLLREGSKHSLYFNPANQTVSTIPRHRDIKKFTTHKICKDLNIIIPEGN